MYALRYFSSSTDGTTKAWVRSFKSQKALRREQEPNLVSMYVDRAASPHVPTALPGCTTSIP
jgi:hypothetical protein